MRPYANHTRESGDIQITAYVMYLTGCS